MNVVLPLGRSRNNARFFGSSNPNSYSRPRSRNESQNDSGSHHGSYNTIQHKSSNLLKFSNADYKRLDVPKTKNLKLT